MQAICEECGLGRAGWKGNNGKGFDRNNVPYCCQSCFLGIGCGCVETGVRRVVVVGQNQQQQQNNDAYIRKMGRQVKAWEVKVAALEERARDRQADHNTAVRKEMTELRRRIEKTRAEINRQTPKASPANAKARSK